VDVRRIIPNEEYGKHEFARVSFSQIFVTVLAASFAR